MYTTKRIWLIQASKLFILKINLTVFENSYFRYYIRQHIFIYSFKLKTINTMKFVVDEIKIAKILFNKIIFILTL